MIPRSRAFFLLSSAPTRNSSASSFLSIASLRSFKVARIGLRCVLVWCSCTLAFDRVSWSSFIRLNIEQSAEPMFVTSSGWTWPLIHMHPSKKSSTVTSHFFPWTEDTSAKITLMSSSVMSARTKNSRMLSESSPISELM